VRTRIIGPCVRTLEPPLLVKSDVFSFFLSVSEGRFFLVGSRLSQREGNFGLPGHVPIIRALAARQARRKTWLVALIPVPLLNIFISRLRYSARARHHLIVLSFPVLPFATNLTTNNRKAIIILARVECLVIDQE